MTENKTVHHYRAFGLEIESQLRLPELKASQAAPDVAIRFGSVSCTAAGNSSDHCVSANQDEVHLFWNEAGSFLMRRGIEMVIQPAEAAEEAVLRIVTLGPGFAAILQQRGNLVLHASAVVIGGKAVAFVGWKGQGKSTTAAALFSRGCLVLTDDLLALNGHDGEVLAHPGFPQFKLWPDSVESSLGEPPEALPKLRADCDKRVRSIMDGFAPVPVPLRVIYVLGHGSEMLARRLTPQESFKQIIANTFCTRYGSRIFNSQTSVAHFQQVARTVAHVPVFRLERSCSLEKLDVFTDFVMRHAMNL